MEAKAFRKTIYAHYKKHRREFPWRETRDPYRILVSELMLQQTQAPRVIEKYEAWVKKYPTFESLSKASFFEVLKLWQGLGYNRRARALLEIAKKVAGEFKGKLPQEKERLMELPGIGPYTAAAILAFAFNKPEPCVETNIRNVYTHFYFKNGRKVRDAELFPLIEETLDLKNPREWFYALMDYGAMLKKTNPLLNARSHHYKKQSKFKGSDREIRGAVLKLLVRDGKTTTAKVAGELKTSIFRVKDQAKALEAEGFVKRKGSVLLPV